MIYISSKNKKKYHNFSFKNINFASFKNICIMHGYVCVILNHILDNDHPQSMFRVKLRRKMNFVSKPKFCLVSSIMLILIFTNFIGCYTPDSFYHGPKGWMKEEAFWLSFLSTTLVANCLQNSCSVWWR